jgi:hypothetical protein
MIRIILAKSDSTQRLDQTTEQTQKNPRISGPNHAGPFPERVLPFGVRRLCRTVVESLTIDLGPREGADINSGYLVSLQVPFFPWRLP